MNDKNSQLVKDLQELSENRSVDGGVYRFGMENLAEFIATREAEGRKIAFVDGGQRMANALLEVRKDPFYKNGTRWIASGKTVEVTGKTKEEAFNNFITQALTDTKEDAPLNGKEPS